MFTHQFAHLTMVGLALLSTASAAAIFDPDDRIAVTPFSMHAPTARSTAVTVLKIAPVIKTIEELKDLVKR